MSTIELVVTRLTSEAQDVRGIELKAADGHALPAFTAGAHVDLHLPGVVRQYSLANDDRERNRYFLGVGLASPSRGGSKHVHEQLAVGDRVQVSAPRALFGIAADASEHLFVAGGIGITPIVSMIHWCVANGRPWRLLYSVRSRARAAFLWTLAPHGAQVQLHMDEESDGERPDLAAFLAGTAPGAHVYCCGPSGLMDAVARTALDAGIPKSATHFERFAAEPAPAADEPAKSFTVVLHRSGARFSVAPGASILEALERNGHAVPFSCREGLCRSCELPLVCGEADHRDFVLSDEERAANKSILVCVSRAACEELVLDA